MWRTRGLVLAVAAAMVLAVSAFSPATAARHSDRDTVAGPLGSTTTVRALDDRFRPRTVTISRGSSVRWTNQGDNIHTTTGGSWNATLSPGESYTKRFRHAGTYPYSCTFHSGMTGRVIVT